MDIQQPFVTQEQKFEFWAEAKDEIQQLRAKVAELEADAERYRFLRNNTSIMTFEQQTWVTSHKLDMRVDKAMSENGYE